MERPNNFAYYESFKQILEKNNIQEIKEFIRKTIINLNDVSNNGDEEKKLILLFDHLLLEEKNGKNLAEIFWQNVINLSVNNDIKSKIFKCLINSAVNKKYPNFAYNLVISCKDKALRKELILTWTVKVVQIGDYKTINSSLNMIKAKTKRPMLISILNKVIETLLDKNDIDYFLELFKQHQDIFTIQLMLNTISYVAKKTDIKCAYGILTKVRTLENEQRLNLYIGMIVKSFAPEFNNVEKIINWIFLDIKNEVVKKNKSIKNLSSEQINNFKNCIKQRHKLFSDFALLFKEKEALFLLNKEQAEKGLNHIGYGLDIPESTYTFFNLMANFTKKISKKVELIMDVDFTCYQRLYVIDAFVKHYKQLMVWVVQSQQSSLLNDDIKLLITSHLTGLDNENINQKYQDTRLLHQFIYASSKKLRRVEYNANDIISIPIQQSLSKPNNNSHDKNKDNQSEYCLKKSKLYGFFLNESDKFNKKDDLIDNQTNGFNISNENEGNRILNYIKPVENRVCSFFSKFLPSIINNKKRNVEQAKLDSSENYTQTKRPRNS